MKERITTLIKAKNLTAAQFADEIGVQKSSISHIISGRNNASLDFIQKILMAYPDVNMDWLMFGKGPLFKASSENHQKVNTGGHLDEVYAPDKLSVDLFSGLTMGKGPDFSKENELRKNNIEKEELLIESSPKSNLAMEPIVEPEAVTPTKTNDETDMPLKRHTLSTTKSIVRIVEFYSDNTFREYFPE